jgi:hypothetical protein
VSQQLGSRRIRQHNTRQCQVLHMLGFIADGGLPLPPGSNYAMLNQHSCQTHEQQQALMLAAAQCLPGCGSSLPCTNRSGTR